MHCDFLNKHGDHIKNSLYLQPWRIKGSLIHVAHGILIMEGRSHVMNSLYLWLLCKEFCVKISFSLWIFGKHGDVKGLQVRSYIDVLFWCVCVSVCKCVLIFYCEREEFFCWGIVVKLGKRDFVIALWEGKKEVAKVGEKEVVGAK